MIPNLALDLLFLQAQSDMASILDGLPTVADGGHLLAWSALVLNAIPPISREVRAWVRLRRSRP